MSKSIAVTLESHEQFTTFSSLVKLAGIYETLNGPQTLTLLAPLNDAFAKFGEANYKRLIDDKKSILIHFIQYHILPGLLKSIDLINTAKLATLNGNNVTVSIHMGDIKINESRIVSSDKLASNGIIHSIDTLL